MIAYNKEWLRNMQISDLLKADLQAVRITSEEYVAIKTAHPVGFYLPGIVARIGFFILTFIIISVSIGFVSLLLADSKVVLLPGYTMFLGLVCYGFLEFFVKDKHYFHSGIDNALLYYAAGLFGGGCIWFIMEMRLNTADTLLSSVIICLLCIYLTLRFADVLTAFTACVSFFSIVYFAWAKSGAFGLATMPFMMMIAAGAVFYLLNRLGKDIRNINYKSCIDYAKIISLVTLYAAGNYFVVNLLNNMLNNLDDSHTSIPLSFIFWIWTFLIPVAYFLLGIRKKSSMFLRLGLVLAAASIATFRNYYHLLPIEIMLTLSGIILLAASYTIIKYLKTPRNGITYAELEEGSGIDKLNIEGLIIGQATSHLPTPAQHPTDRFGGGTGGGGGSSGEF